MIKLCFKIFAAAAIFILVGHFGYAQGCSDAGFCSLKYHDNTIKNYKNSIAIGNTSGIADGNTFINASYITYSRQLHKKVYWDTKVTANYASGKLANNFNAGDVFTSFSLQAAASKDYARSLKILAGLKIPLTAANDKAGGKPLPMAYQSSLGTYDLLLGINYNINNWEFTNAWQLPLTKQNKNTFLKEYTVSNDFSSTNKFQRKADVLIRAAYDIKKAAKNISLKPNILAIYHLADDSYEDIFSMRRTLTGSQGLTLNANIIGKYAINKSSSIELSLAAPFVVRDVRPDGLTRKFTAGLEYKFSF
jgi:hypothetical protein